MISPPESENEVNVSVSEEYCTSCDFVILTDWVQKPSTYTTTDLSHKNAETSWYTLCTGVTAK